MLNERFISVRKDKGLTANAVANIMDVSRKHLVEIEKGEVSPRVNFVVKFAQVFKTDVNWMLTGYHIKSDGRLDAIRKILNKDC